MKDKILEDGYSSVLDVGCGDGRFLNFLNETKGYKKLKGVDLSEKAIRLAQAMNDKSIEFERKDIADETEKYEAITCIEVLEHIPEEELGNFLRGISNALDNGGRVFVTVPSVNVPLNKKHYRHYTLGLLEEQLSASNSGLKVEEGFYIVPLKTIYDKIVGKILNNRFYELKCYDNWCWRRLWRKGLITTETKGEHVFCVLVKEKIM